MQNEHSRRWFLGLGATWSAALVAADRERRPPPPSRAPRYGIVSDPRPDVVTKKPKS